MSDGVGWAVRSPRQESTGAERPASAGAVRRKPRGYLVKRALDVIGAAGGLVVLSPALLTIAAIIRLDSPGPVIFRQPRIGKDGVPFTFYKFRSMHSGCDPKVHERHVVGLIRGEAGDECRSADGSFKMLRDDRLTRVGAFLRRTSIDELPQLFNVLVGDMSLVGPRPPLEYEVAAYEPRHTRRLEVLPGMTGLWQVSGRTRLSFEQMIDLDLCYIDEWSLGLDLRILLKTVTAVTGGEGAG